MTDVNWHLETLAPWVSAGVRKVLAMENISAEFGTTFGEVAASLGAAGVVASAPAYARYFGMPSEFVDVEIGFGIPTAADVPCVVVTEHPATPALIGTHVGPYDQLHASYDTLPGWLEANPTELSDSMFEFYESEPDADPQVTKLVFPLA